MNTLIGIFFTLWATGAIVTLVREDMFATVVSVFLACGLAAVLFMSLVFLVARHIKRYDLVDAAWGGVFAVVAVTSFALQPGAWFEADLQALVTVLVLLWGGRLAFHILQRIRTTDHEDPRYVELRKAWRGNLALNVYGRIYLVQAALALLICVPVMHINLFADNGITMLAWVGLAVWLVGYYFETVGDRQLRLFISNPQNKGRIMQAGLWRYTRHPNYFGELTQWWGIFLMCLSTPFGVVGIIGPVLITYLILFVSGIPLNEKRFEGRPGWATYKARTSAILPLPPRRA